MGLKVAYVSDEAIEKDAQALLADYAQERGMPIEALQYDNLSKHFAMHDTVNHGLEEYVRGDVTTNTVEGYFSIFKRGMKGVYQHCGKKHLHRYAAEFAFRYSNRVANGVAGKERSAIALLGVSGKRLTYQGSNR